MPGPANSITLRKLNPFLFILLYFAIGASCQKLVTYSSKSSEELQCPITDQIGAATWTDETTAVTINLASYLRGDSDIQIPDPGPKHRNFNYTLSATSFSLLIKNVEAEDGGNYRCTTIGVGGSFNDYSIFVEVLAKPNVTNRSQDVDVLDVIVGTPYVLTCSAAGARSESDLSLMWDPSLVENTDLIVTPNGNFTDYSITSTYIAKKGDSTITCQLTGYVTQDEINDQLITDTVNLNVRYAPMCTLDIQEGEDCTEVTLTCECDAVPADITQYSFFNGSSLINNETSNTFTESVAYETSTGFSCSATNEIGPGRKSDVKVHECKKESGSLTAGAIVGISLGVVAVVVVIVVVAVIMCKKGEDDSKPSDSSVTDGNVTATNINITSSEPASAPLYGVVKKDSKKKSDKPDDNGAGPGKDPEIPAYGVIDKNRTKDPTPAPRSSMRDSKNPSKPKQDGPMEMKYADLDHGNKPPSDEVRKPKEEPTEYATVQPVIV